MNNNEEPLRQCIASGRVSASQIEAHRQAGDLSDEHSSGVTTQSPAAKFKVGALVTKVKGSQWTGRVVGTYSTTLTPEGYAVESSTERGSVQIYPAAALELVEGAQTEQSVPAPLNDDTALLDFIEQHPEMFPRHRKGRWAFVGFTNYEIELMPTLRDAVRAAIAAQKGTK